MAQLVYFIQAGTDGPIKIGLAADPHARLRDLQTGQHEELRLIGTARGGERLEQWLHVRFFDWNVRGEWFRSDAPGLRDYIERVGFAGDAPIPSMQPLEVADPISDRCGECGWPMEGELADRWEALCYRCLCERYEAT